MAVYIKTTFQNRDELSTLPELMKQISLIKVMNNCQKSALNFSCIHKFQFSRSYQVDKSV